MENQKQWQNECRISKIYIIKDKVCYSHSIIMLVENVLPNEVRFKWFSHGMVFLTRER